MRQASRRLCHHHGHHDRGHRRDLLVRHVHLSHHHVHLCHHHQNHLYIVSISPVVSIHLRKTHHVHLHDHHRDHHVHRGHRRHDLLSV